MYLARAAGNSALRAIVPANGQTIGTPVGGGGTNYAVYTATKGYSTAQLRAGLANGTLVTVPYDNVRGNAFIQLDLRVSKSFTFRERNRLELLCQVFDLNNRANFGNQYNNNVRSAAFGTPANYLSTSGTMVPYGLQAEIGFQYRF